MFGSAQEFFRMGTRLPGFLYVLVLFCFLSTVSLGQQISPRPLVTKPVIESELTTLKGNTHPLAQPRFDIGAASPDLPLNRMLLVLKRSPEQEHALRSLLDDQQDKASPHYHKWLTPDGFGTQFGPADQDLQTVTGWLQSHGFAVNRVTHGRSVIEFSGTEGQVEEALHTSIHKYAVNGKEHWANASDPQIPAALSPIVAGVWSLHNFKKKSSVRISKEVLKTKYTPGKRPNTTLSGIGGPIHALSPADFGVIYNIAPLYANSSYGQGVSIAVVARSNLFNGGQDVFNFEQVFDPLCCGGVQIVLDGPDPGDLGGGEEAEATLDATWTSAIAPAANVKFVVSASTDTTDGVDLSELYIIDNNLAPIMTESFGSCDALATQSEALGLSALAEQAAAQGITYMVSSGDSGAAGCSDPNFAPAVGGQSPSVLGTSFNVVVGGTQFNENGNDAKYWSNQNAQDGSSVLSYVPEDAWNESCSGCSFPNLFSSGGGVSRYYAPKPTWQFGVTGIPNDGARDQPDVALAAAAEHDPYLLCLEGSCVPDSNGSISIFLIGGTSASSPSFAGIMALVDQQNGPQGQANYVLYRLAANQSASGCNGSSTTTAPAASCVFNDVTSGNNSVPGQPGFSAGTGYDLVTGLGSVNVNQLVTKWNTVNFLATTTNLGPATVTGAHGSPITLNISVTPNSSGGVPSGDVSLITSNNQGVGFVPLTNGAQSASISNLPGGSYTLTGQYGGDKTFAPSPPSSPVNVTISAESSTTALKAIDQNLNPFTAGQYGTFVYVRADVAGHSGQGVPTGNVSFTDSSQNINPGPYLLNSEGNTAVLNLTTFYAVGQHSITGTYLGDSSFTQSTSSPVTFSIAQANTGTVLTSAGAPQGADLTATIGTSSFGLPPSGTVTFFAGSNNLGSAGVQTLSGSSGPVTFATLSATQLANGQYTITANYSGDTNYIASSSGPAPINIQPDFSIQPSTTALPIQRPGSSGTMTISMTDLDGFTGAVTFSCSGLPAEAKCAFSPASLSATGSTTLTVTTVAKTGMLKRGGTIPQGTLTLAMVGMTIGGVFIVGVPPNRRRRRKLLLTVLLGALCAGCGGGGGTKNQGPPPDAGTPSGIYVVTLTGSSGSTTHSVQFGLGIF
jgi:hypothetical protein